MNLLLRLIPSAANPFYWQRVWNEVRLAWQVARDRRVPQKLKLIPLAVAAYLVSPLDLVPGFLPIIGQLDDLALLMLGVNLFVRLAPQDIVAEYKRRLNPPEAN